MLDIRLLSWTHRLAEKKKFITRMRENFFHYARHQTLALDTISRKTMSEHYREKKIKLPTCEEDCFCHRMTYEKIENNTCKKKNAKKT